MVKFILRLLFFKKCFFNIFSTVDLLISCLWNGFPVHVFDIYFSGAKGRYTNAGLSTYEQTRGRGPSKNEQKVVMGVEQSGIMNGPLFWMFLILRKYYTCCEKNLE